MSETVDLLLSVQGLDVEMIEVLARLKAARAALDEPPELRATRGALARAEEELRRLSADQQATEAEVESLKGKVTALEKRLYGQVGMNPKTVVPLQAEIAYNREQIGVREDRIVELMVGVEAQEAEVRRLRDSVVALEALHAGQLPQLRAEVAGLEEKGEAVKARRRTLAARVPPAALQVYRTLAASGKGRPVVRMTGGTCHGCGATLPTAEAQRVRQIPDLPRCPRCGHIVTFE